MIKPKALFLCLDNGCRTQMAEAFRRDVAVMDEAEPDFSEQTPRKVNRVLRERVAFPVTLSDWEVERTCPIFPGAVRRLKCIVAYFVPAASPNPVASAVLPGRTNSAK